MSAAGEAALRPADWRRVALWGSLAANVFFAGLVGSHVLLRPAPPSAPGLDGFIARLAAALPPADAERFRGVLDAERPWFNQARTAADRAHGRLADAIARTPYDESEARQRLQEWRARWNESSDRFGDSLLTAVRTLSPEGRQLLADTLRRPHH